ncbi:MAG: hypothetical protein ACYCOU_14810 [Sulfobacillus sp.]
MPGIKVIPISVGGGAVINYTTTATGGTLTLERSSDGGTSWITLFTKDLPMYGNFSVFSDLGEGQIDPVSGFPIETHLDFTTTYLYRVTDASGAAVSDSITPNQRITVDWDQMTYSITRILQSGIKALVLPENIRPAKVFQILPTGQIMPDLPIITVNQQLLQMAETQIGLTNSTNPFTGVWEMPILTTRRFSIYVETLDTQSLNYYHDAIIGIFLSAQTDLMNSLALQQNIHIQFQSTQGGESGGRGNPNRYWAEIQLDMKGPWNLKLAYQNTGLISQISVQANGNTVATVPVG